MLDNIAGWDANEIKVAGEFQMMFTRDIRFGRHCWEIGAAAKPRLLASRSTNASN